MFIRIQNIHLLRLPDVFTDKSNKNGVYLKSWQLIRGIGVLLGTMARAKGHLRKLTRGTFCFRCFFMLFFFNFLIHFPFVPGSLSGFGHVLVYNG